MPACSRRSFLATAGLATAAVLSGRTATAAGLDAERRRQLDTFFSNFSETGLESFAAGHLSDAAMLDFALSHVLINARHELKLSASGETGAASAALVDKVTVRYFDQKLEAGRQPSYSVPIGDGEAYVFSQVGDLRELGGGLFAATGSIYSAPSGATIDPHAKPESWAKAGDDVEKVATFAATIKQIDKRFVLVEYQMQPVD